MNLARFLVNGTPSSPGGFDATNGQTLTFALEASSSLVQRVTFEVYSAADSASPRCSKGAPSLSLTGATVGAKVDAATPASGVTVVMPVSGAHSYIVRCTVNGGLDAYGRPNAEQVFERMVSIRSGTRRKIVASEGTQYEPDGWAGAQGDDIDGAVPAGAGASLASVRVAITAPVASLAACPVLQDSVTLLEGDTVLLCQTPGHLQNGPYTVGVVGGGTAPLTRRSDFNTSAEAVPGVSLTAREGTSNQGIWFLQNGLPITLNTTALTFVKASGGAATVGDTSIAIVSNVAKLSTKIVISDQPYGATTRQGTNVATTTGGSATVALTLAGDLVNGDSIVIPGAGGDPALATPAAPTVQQFGAPGARTRSYKVIYQTLEGGYSAPSPATTITDGPATCTFAAGVQVFVPRDTTSGAQWFLVYEQLDGAGNYVFKGCGVLAAHNDESSEVFVPVVRFTADGSPNSPYGVPVVRVSTGADKVCPTTGARNMHRARIVSGAGTTSIVLDLACAGTIANAQLSHCNWLPWRDAQLSFGSITSQLGGELLFPIGVYRAVKNFHTDRANLIRGCGGGRSDKAPTQIKFENGYGMQADGSRNAEKWSPACYNRVGDRIQRLATAGALGVIFECTTAGYSATTEPAWNTASLATTADGTAVWTTHLAGNTGASGRIVGLGFRWVDVTRPPLPWFSRWRDAAGKSPDIANNVQWVASTVRALNVYVRPTVPTGFIYKCTTAGTSSATEPVWTAAGKLKDGATFADGTVVWTALDCRQQPGAGLLIYCRMHIEDLNFIDCGGNNIVFKGSGVEGTNCNNFVIKDCRMAEGRAGGILAIGQDANNGAIENCDVTTGYGPALCDMSQIGCLWFNCHASGNHITGLGDPDLYFSYSNNNNNAQYGCMFLACYEEASQTHDIRHPASCIGGTWAGAHSTTTDPKAFGVTWKVFAEHQIENPGSSLIGYDYGAADGILYKFGRGANDLVTIISGSQKLNLRSQWDTERILSFNGSNAALGRVWDASIMGIEGRGLAAPRILLGPSSSERRFDARTIAQANAPTDGQDAYWARLGDFTFDAGGGSRLGWTPNASTGKTALTWAASTYFYAGVPIAANGRVYVPREDGISAAGASPTAGWTLTTGGSVVDGTITWECRGTDTGNLQSVAHPSPPPGANLTDADATLVWSTGGAWRKLPVLTLTANRTLTLSIAGLVAQDAGIRQRITRYDVGRYRVGVLNAGPSGGTTFMRGGRAQEVVFQLSATLDWELVEYGELSNSPTALPGPALTDANVTRQVSDGAQFTLPAGTLTAARNVTNSVVGAVNKQTSLYLIQAQSFDYDILDGAGALLHRVPAGAEQGVAVRYLTAGVQWELHAMTTLTS